MPLAGRQMRTSPLPPTPNPNPNPNPTPTPLVGTPGPDAHVHHERLAHTLTGPHPTPPHRHDLQLEFLDAVFGCTKEIEVDRLATCTVRHRQGLRRGWSGVWGRGGGGVCVWGGVPGAGGRAGRTPHT